MSKPNIYRRIVCFFFGLSLCGFGIAICTQAGLGTTPISSLPYVLSFITPLTLGAWTVVVNAVFIALQIAILGRDFKKVQLLQMGAVVVFGACIDLGMHLASLLHPGAYALRILELLVGCAVMSFGIALQALSDVLYVPGEGLVKSVCKRFGFDFGFAKVGLDSTLTLCALILSLLALGCVQGLREGTLIAALLVGLLVRFFIKRLRFLKMRFYSRPPFPGNA